MVKLQNATILTNLLIENAKVYMTQVGSLFPFFILMKSGSPMFVEMDAEEVINVQNDDDPEFEDIYRSVVYLRMDRDEDAVAVQPVAAHLVETYNPDAIAFVVPSYYKLSYNSKDDDVYTLDKDPEAIQILYTTLYLADDPVGYLKIIPYKQIGEETSVEKIADGFKHRFHFGDFPWATSDITMKGRFENPFKQS